MMLRPLAALLTLCIALAPAASRAQGVVQQRVSGKRITTVALRIIRSLPSDANHAFIAAFAVPDQLVAPGRVDLVVGTPIVTPNYVNVPVQIEVDGKFDRTVFAGYRVQQYVETAVAAHDIAPGSVLAAEDLAIERVAYAGHPGNGIDVLVGRKVSVPYLKGQPVFIESTFANAIVKAGSTVILIIRDGGVVLTADVVARQNGGLGDQVSVYNPSTNKTLSGVVTGPGTVELDLPGGTN